MGTNAIYDHCYYLREFMDQLWVTSITWVIICLSLEGANRLDHPAFHSVMSGCGFWHFSTWFSAIMTVIRLRVQTATFPM